jgi:hypothetical protein
MTYFPRALWCKTSPNPVPSIPACINTKKLLASFNVKFQKLTPISQIRFNPPNKSLNIKEQNHLLKTKKHVQLNLSIYTCLLNTKNPTKSKTIFELISHGEASITGQKQKNRRILQRTSARNRAEPSRWPPIRLDNALGHIKVISHGLSSIPIIPQRFQSFQNIIFYSLLLLNFSPQPPISLTN